MADKKKMNKADFRQKFIRIMCFFMAFLMVFSVAAAILSVL